MKISRILAKCLEILDSREKSLLLAIMIIQVLLSFLDLMGVALLGLLGNLAIVGFGAGTTGVRAEKFLSFMRIAEFSRNQQIVILGFSASGFLILKTLAGLYLTRKTNGYLARRSAYLSGKIALKFFNRPVTQVNKLSIQETIWTLTSGINTITLGMIGVFINLVSDIILILILSSALFLTDPSVALFSTLVFSIVAALLYFFTHAKVQKLGMRQAERGIAGQQNISELISAYRELTVRNRRLAQVRNMTRVQYELAEDSANIAFYQYIGKYILEITLVITGLLFSFYQFATQSAARAVAILAIFLVASSRIAPAALRVQQSLLRIKGNAGVASSTFALFEELKGVEPLVEITSNVNYSKYVSMDLHFTPTVKIQALDFSYNSNSMVLNDISMEIFPGEVVAIVGPSGSGKTTLMDCILGLLDPTRGTVTISGLNPQLAFARWPGMVGYVPQDVAIYEGTIKSNLTLGYPENEFTDEELWSVLDKAYLTEVVRKLPLKLESLVGDRGTQLSGGQRQRLGIARTLLSDPKLIFLDEATSSLDGETERNITESIMDMKGSTTIVIIAHRLATVTNADKIIYLDSGRIKGVGTFSELRRSVREFESQVQVGKFE